MESDHPQVETKRKEELLGYDTTQQFKSQAGDTDLYIPNPALGHIM